MSKIIMFFIHGWHETENTNEDIAMTTFQIKKYWLYYQNLHYSTTDAYLDAF